MPRIRTLKPEHRQHRKVGKLSHVSYRLWIGMILEADDEGRLVCDIEQLRVLIFGYHPKVTRAVLEAALEELRTSGLVRTYGVGGRPYADFPSWHDHQRIDRKQPSKLPMYEHSTNGQRPLDTDLDLEGNGSEGNGSDHHIVGLVSDPSNARWGKPHDLVTLFNRLAPPGLARVNRLTSARRDKATKYLREFPEREFWVTCFSELKFSRFLLGLTPAPGHENFRGDFDWLLTKGKDGTENCMKVAEGKYRDKEHAP